MADVGNRIQAENARWSFEKIAEQFDEHVRQSVPLYDEGHELICEASDFFLPEKATVIELGVSTGTLTQKFLQHNRHREDLRYIGIDRSQGMIDRARERCGGDPRLKLICEDIEGYAFEHCSMVLSYYTIQFVHPRLRQDLIDRIYQSLDWGGAFLQFEKVRGPDARFQDICSQLYQEYKLQQSFTEAEILQKQRSLKGVLEPFSTQGNLDLLKRAGFTDIMTVMKWVCFEGFLAIK